MVICNTGVPFDSDAIIQEKSVNVERGELQATQSLKQEAVAMKEALLKKNIRRFAEVLAQGWLSKKRTASAVTNLTWSAFSSSQLTETPTGARCQGAGGWGTYDIRSGSCAPPRCLSRAAKGARILTVQLAEQGAIAWRLK